MPAVAGFAMSSVGFAALVVELAARGWRGLATLPLLPANYDPDSLSTDPGGDCNTDD